MKYVKHTSGHLEDEHETGTGLLTTLSNNYDCTKKPSHNANEYVHEKFSLDK